MDDKRGQSGPPIDPRQPIPVYFQLKNLLLEEILAGRFASGERLPTEQELCARYRISRNPVNRALTELADEGVIVRYRKRGSFVNPHWARRVPDRPEVRVVVPEGPWSPMIRDAARSDFQINLLTIPPSTLRHVLTQAVAEGQAPDVAIIDSVWVPEFASAGFVRSFESIQGDWMRPELREDLLASVIRPNRFNSQTFGVSALANVAGLWYSKRRLERRQLAAPRTWDELRAAARGLLDSGLKRPLIIPAGPQGGETTTYCLSAFLASNSAQVLDAEAVVLDSTATVQTLRFLRTLVEEALMPAEVVAYDWDRGRELLATGRTAMCFGGSHDAGPLAEVLDIPLRNLWDHFGFVPIPAGPLGRPATVLGALSLVVFMQTRQPRVALQLVERTFAPALLADIAASTGRAPARRSAAQIAAQQLPFLAETTAMLEHAVTRPMTPYYSRVSNQLQVMIENVITGRVAPDTAAKHTADMLGAITGLPVRGRDEPVRVIEPGGSDRLALPLAAERSGVGGVTSAPTAGELE
jgi:multiple sugar transport system substrate-binding protein